MRRSMKVPEDENKTEAPVEGRRTRSLYSVTELPLRRSSRISKQVDISEVPEVPKLTRSRSRSSLVETPTEFSKPCRDIRAGSETKTMTPGRITRRTRASSVTMSDDDLKVSLSSWSAYGTPSRSHKRLSMVPSQSPVAEETQNLKEQDCKTADIPVILIEDEISVESDSASVEEIGEADFKHKDVIDSTKTPLKSVPTEIKIENNVSNGYDKQILREDSLRENDEKSPRILIKTPSEKNLDANQNSSDSFSKRKLSFSPKDPMVISETIVLDKKSNSKIEIKKSKAVGKTTESQIISKNSKSMEDEGNDTDSEVDVCGFSKVDEVSNATSVWETVSKISMDCEGSDEEIEICDRNPVEKQSVVVLEDILGKVKQKISRENSLKHSFPSTNKPLERRSISEGMKSNSLNSMKRSSLSVDLTKKIAGHINETSDIEGHEDKENTLQNVTEKEHSNEEDESIVPETEDESEIEKEDFSPANSGKQKIVEKENRTTEDSTEKSVVGENVSVEIEIQRKDSFLKEIDQFVSNTGLENQNSPEIIEMTPEKKSSKKVVSDSIQPKILTETPKEVAESPSKKMSFTKEISPRKSKESPKKTESVEIPSKKQSPPRKIDSEKSFKISPIKDVVENSSSPIENLKSPIQNTTNNSSSKTPESINYKCLKSVAVSLEKLEDSYFKVQSKQGSLKSPNFKKAGSLCSEDGSPVNFNLTFECDSDTENPDIASQKKIENLEAEILPDNEEEGKHNSSTNKSETGDRTIEIEEKVSDHECTMETFVSATELISNNPAKFSALSWKSTEETFHSSASKISSGNSDLTHHVNSKESLDETNSENVEMGRIYNSSMNLDDESEVQKINKSLKKTVDRQLSTDILETIKSIENVEVSKSVEKLEVSKSTEKLETSNSTEESKVLKPIEKLNISKSKEDSETSNSAEKSEVFKSTENLASETMDNLKSIEELEPSKSTSEVLKSTENILVSKSAEKLEISKSTEEPETSKMTKESEISRLNVETFDSKLEESNVVNSKENQLMESESVLGVEKVNSESNISPSSENKCIGANTFEDELEKNNCYFVDITAEEYSAQQAKCLSNPEGGNEAELILFDDEEADSSIMILDQDNKFKSLNRLSIQFLEEVPRIQPGAEEKSPRKLLGKSSEKCEKSPEKNQQKSLEKCEKSPEKVLQQYSDRCEKSPEKFQQEFPQKADNISQNKCTENSIIIPQRIEKSPEKLKISPLKQSQQITIEKDQFERRSQFYCSLEENSPEVENEGKKLNRPVVTKIENLKEKISLNQLLGKQGFNKVKSPEKVEKLTAKKLKSSNQINKLEVQGFSQSPKTPTSPFYKRLDENLRKEKHRKQLPKFLMNESSSEDEFDDSENKMSAEVCQFLERIKETTNFQKQDAEENSKKKKKKLKIAEKNDEIKNINETKSEISELEVNSKKKKKKRKDNEAENEKIVEVEMNHEKRMKKKKMINKVEEKSEELEEMDNELIKRKTKKKSKNKVDNEEILITEVNFENRKTKKNSKIGKEATIKTRDTFEEENIVKKKRKCIAEIEPIFKKKKKPKFEWSVDIEEVLQDREDIPKEKIKKKKKWEVNEIGQEEIIEVEAKLKKKKNVNIEKKLIKKLQKKEVNPYEEITEVDEAENEEIVEIKVKPEKKKKKRNVNFEEKLSRKLKEKEIISSEEATKRKKKVNEADNEETVEVEAKPEKKKKKQNVNVEEKLSRKLEEEVVLSEENLKKKGKKANEVDNGEIVETFASFTKQKKKKKIEKAKDEIENRKANKKGKKEIKSDVVEIETIYEKWKKTPKIVEVKKANKEKEKQEENEVKEKRQKQKKEDKNTKTKRKYNEEIAANFEKTKKQRLDCNVNIENKRKSPKKEAPKEEIPKKKKIAYSELEEEKKTRLLSKCKDWSIEACNSKVLTELNKTNSGFKIENVISKREDKLHKKGLDKRNTLNHKHQVIKKKAQPQNIIANVIKRLPKEANKCASNSLEEQKNQQSNVQNFNKGSKSSQKILREICSDRSRLFFKPKMTQSKKI